MGGDRTTGRKGARIESKTWTRWRRRGWARGKPGKNRNPEILGHTFRLRVFGSPLSTAASGWASAVLMLDNTALPCGAAGAQEVQSKGSVLRA